MVTPSPPGSSRLLHGALQLQHGHAVSGADAPGAVRGLLRGAWGTTDNNRKARFYSLTAAGRRQLDKEIVQAWDRMATIIRTLTHGEA